MIWDETVAFILKITFYFYSKGFDVFKRTVCKVDVKNRN
jgi:hypothetical protein